MLFVVLILASACGEPSATRGGTVRVLGTWEGTELDAFLTVVAPFEAETGIEVLYTATRDLRGAIADDLARDEPPDLAGLEGPAHMRELASAGALQDLADVIDAQAYKADVAPTFIELGTVDGRLVGGFLKSTLKGLVWYSPPHFRRGTPHTVDELQGMARAALGGPTREWCVGLESAEASGWPGTDWVEVLLLRQAGTDAYDRWAAGDLPWTSAEVKRAFESYGQVVAADAVFGGTVGALATPFAAAGDPLFDDPPGCLLMLQGSFMPVFFQAAGKRPAADYDFFPFPGDRQDDRGEVIGAGDLVGVLTDNPDAGALMGYLLGAEAQQRWVAHGGALSVNHAVTEYPDDVVAREAALLTGATHFRFDASDLMRPELSAAFRSAVLEFTRDQTRLGHVLDGLEDLRVVGP